MLTCRVFFCLRALKAACQVLFHQRDSWASQVCAALVLSLCWKGTARHFKDILRLCSFVADFHSEKLIYFVYA